MTEPSGGNIFLVKSSDNVYEAVVSKGATFVYKSHRKLNNKIIGYQSLDITEWSSITNQICVRSSGK